MCIIAQTTNKMNARLDEHPVTYLRTQFFKLHDILVVVPVRLQMFINFSFQSTKL